MLKQSENERKIQTAQQGYGRPAVGIYDGQRQMVGVGSTVYFSDKWKTFSDFLRHYITVKLQAEWGDAELKKPFSERHPIVQWFEHVRRHWKQHSKGKEGLFSTTPTGAVTCYLGLAHNLYLLDHNVELQERLINRLKNVEQFQGAYYETIVAGTLIRAGFELALEDETDDSGKHCEFFAKSSATDLTYSVEAKSRAVAGIKYNPCTRSTALSFASTTERFRLHGLAAQADGSSLTAHSHWPRFRRAFLCGAPVVVLWTGAGEAQANNRPHKPF